MALHDKIRSLVDRESDTRHMSWIYLDGEISRVKVDSNWTLIGLPLADANLYLLGSTACNDRSSSEAMETGMTSATHPESGRLGISPLVTSSWITVSIILEVGSDIVCESVATTPWLLAG